MKKYLFLSLVFSTVFILFVSCDKKQTSVEKTAESVSNVSDALADVAKDVSAAYSEAVTDFSSELKGVLEDEDVESALSALGATTDALKSVLDPKSTSSSSSKTGSRKEIDDFFKSYEAFITKAEKANKDNDTMALLSLTMESATLSTKALDLQDNSAWTIEDSMKYTTLSVKAADALQ